MTISMGHPIDLLLARAGGEASGLIPRARGIYLQVMPEIEVDWTLVYEDVGKFYCPKLQLIPTPKTRAVSSAVL